MILYINHYQEIIKIEIKLKKVNVICIQRTFSKW